MQDNTPTQAHTPTLTVADRVRHAILERLERAAHELKAVQLRITQQFEAGCEVSCSDIEGLLKWQAQARTLGQLNRVTAGAEDLTSALSEYLEDGLDNVLRGSSSSTSMVFNEGYKQDREALADAVQLVRSLLRRLQ